MSATEKHLMPQDILFEEGDQSANLFILKKGVIRIFKRKAEGNIELETIRAGQLIGELAFLDNLERSASAEALTSCELVEIPRSALDETMKKLPEWFVALTKTITNRLRNSNNKVRTLEAMSVEYGMDRNGNRSKEYTYLNTNELLRFSTALLAVASRYGKNATLDGIEFTQAMLERFATQMLQVNSSKVISLIEVFKSCEVLKGDLFLTDIRFLDQFIQFVNDQNLMDPAKKRILSDAGFSILTLVAQNSGKATVVNETASKINIAPVLKAFNVPLNQLQELHDQKFLSSMLIVSADEVNIEFNPKQIIFDFRAFGLFNALEKLNVQKRKG